jgi:hypothetical protein
MRISQNGWPASKDPDEIQIISRRVPGSGLKLRVAAPVAPLLIAFARDFHKEVERINEGQLDDWGYAFRDIRGATTLSNHASGTAIDLNATQHPLGAENTFTDEQARTIRRLCRKYGLRWGGDYRNRKDEMHFEVVMNATQVQNLIRTLGLERDGDQEAKEADKDSEAISGILEQNSSSSSDRVLPRHRRRHTKGAI